MAVFIEANYSKKIGLPAYSSHSFSVTLRSEVSELKDVDREASKLYAILQGAVDAQIVEAGFTPEQNGHGSTTPRTTSPASQPNGDQWACSDKQRDLILKIVDEHRLDKNVVEEKAKQLFNQPVKSLDRLQASGLIADLLQTYGPAKTNGGNGNRRQYQRRQS